MKLLRPTLSLVFEKRDDNDTLIDYRRFILDQDTAVGFCGLMSWVQASKPYYGEEGENLDFYFSDFISHFMHNWTLPTIYLVGQEREESGIDLQSVLEAMRLDPPPENPKYARCREGESRDKLTREDDSQASA
jgi:hypothetical protein